MFSLHAQYPGGMRELRYLALPRGMLNYNKLRLSNLVNLEVLKNFSTKSCSLMDLQGMAKLRTFEIFFDHGMSVETLFSSISGLRHPTTLTIIDRRSIIRKGFVFYCSPLNKLELNMYIPQLPEEQNFPSHLTIIILTECCSEKDPMPILETFPQLKEVTLRVQAFSVKRMVCSRGGFPQLHKLELFELLDWEEWIVEEDSMPLLHTLNIMGCGMLKELPDGLRFITSLKELFTQFMGMEWKDRLSRGGVDYYKVQNIPSVQLG